MDISARTAIARTKASVPMQIVQRRHFLSTAYPILDWGCGKGADVSWLKDIGYDAYGYDPNHQPVMPSFIIPVPIVTCFYVVNVIDNPNERIRLMKDILNFLPEHGRVLLAARSWSDIHSAADKGDWLSDGDGYRTKSGTFQRGFSESQLQSLCFDAGFCDALTINSEPNMISAWKGTN